MVIFSMQWVAKFISMTWMPGSFKPGDHLNLAIKEEGYRLLGKNTQAMCLSFKLSIKQK